MADLVFKNFASSVLAFDLKADATVAIVADGDVFPDAPAEGEFVVVLEDATAVKEIARCTARSGNALTLTRAQENTTALAFSAGTVVELRLTAESMDEYFQRRGYDGGIYTDGDSGGDRSTIQLRRNIAVPGDVPEDLYEGELAIDLSMVVPRLFVGLVGAEGDGVGKLVAPIHIGPTEPTDPYNKLLWINNSNYEMKIFNNGKFQNLSVFGLTGEEFVTGDQLDEIVNELSYQLSAPRGTQLVAIQATAPLGWVQSTLLNDRVMRLVTGSTGGALGGNWQFATDEVALSTAQMPAHNHGGGGHDHEQTRANIVNLEHGGGAVVQFQGVAGYETLNTTTVTGLIDSEGGGEGHSHLINSDGSWRPSYVDTIAIVRG